MTLVQVWLVVGIPALALATLLFIGRSAWRSVLGYIVLLAAAGVMVSVSPASGAVFGALIAVLYASGRGGTMERSYDPVSDTSHRAVAAMEPDVERSSGEAAETALER